jgi:hypothetical protein
MMKSMIQDVDAEQLAKVFHHYHEALAHDCDAPAGEGALAWERTPETERKLMVAAARLTLLELAAPPTRPGRTRKYFAKPGEADWGC